MAGEQFISISHTFRSESITRSYLQQCIGNEAGMLKHKTYPNSSNEFFRA